MLFKKQIKANKFANALNNAIEIEEQVKGKEGDATLERMQSTSKDIKNAAKDM